MKVKLFTTSICNNCHGYGFMADHKHRYFDCPKCKAKGLIFNFIKICKDKT